MQVMTLSFVCETLIYTTVCSSKCVSDFSGSNCCSLFVFGLRPRVPASSVRDVHGTLKPPRPRPLIDILFPGTFGSHESELCVPSWQEKSCPATSIYQQRRPTARFTCGVSSKCARGVCMCGLWTVTHTLFSLWLIICCEGEGKYHASRTFGV